MANGRRIAFIAAGALAIGGVTGGVWAVSPIEATSTAHEASGGAEIPANGYVANGKCYVVIGQGGFSQEVPCSSFHLLPPKVRQCAGTVASGALLGWLYGPLEALGEAVKAGSAGGAVSCVPWGD